MELDELIPLKFKPTIGGNWVVRNNYLMYKHYEHIPVAFIDDGVVYIFLDNRIQRQILKLTKWIMSLGYEFYFTTPELSNPSGVYNPKEKVINNYLFSYIQPKFFEGFRKINFDIIKNMVDWAQKEDCVDLIRGCYISTKKIVDRVDYDYYSNQKKYSYEEEIRDDYSKLYRDIQINQIL